MPLFRLFWEVQVQVHYKQRDGERNRKREKDEERNSSYADRAFFFVDKEVK